MEAAVLTPKVCPACNSRYGVEVAFCSRDGTPLVTDPGSGHTAMLGQILAERYRIVALLGEGGMGQVFEAQHVNINKRFAVKLLRPEIVSNTEAVARFRQEAWSASSIGHENIVEIDDFATLPNGAVYLAMEFLKGHPLSERMRTPPPMALAESLDLLMQVCRGLAAAHDKGIVHRDMKPENVFLAEKHGRVIAKILDFGIAKVSGAEGAQSLTRTGTIFGTPHYMSPEQALGRALDHRADIYSVGVIMYEVFTGRVPFEAESFMGILTKHITVQPTAPREIAPQREILPEVEAIILRAMAKEVADRYQSMNELLLDLQKVAEVYAPQLLVQPAGTPSAQYSSPSSSAVRTATPTPMPSPSRVIGAATSAELAAVKQSRSGVWIGVVIAAMGVVAAVLLLTRPKPPAVVVAPAEKTDTKPIAKPDPAPPDAKDVTILIDSEPVGAEILKDGARLGDTPWNLTLVGGQPETITLRKAGYVNQPVTLKPDGESRRVVHLVRVKPKDPPPPLITPSGSSSKPITKKPHESVEEPKKGSDIINPYQ